VAGRLSGALTDMRRREELVHKGVVASGMLPSTEGSGTLPQKSFSSFKSFNSNMRVQKRLTTIDEL